MQIENSKQDKLAKLFMQKDQILQSFPFEKVHAFMLLSKWQWVKTEDTTYYQPTIEDLKIHASVLIDRAIFNDKDIASVGTGGLHCYKWEYGLKLTFDAFYSTSY